MRRLTLSAFLSVAAFAAAAGAQERFVTVIASDFKFDAPDSIAAGVTTFRLVSTGPELHHMQIARLDSGKTMADLGQAMNAPGPHGPPPPWVVFVGGPNAGVPDGRTATVVTMTLSAGNYVLICFIPSPDGTPHVMKGMIRPLTVVGSPASATQAGAPKAEIVMTLYDYNFDFDRPLTAGRRTILIKNTSPQWHEAFLAKLLPGATVSAFLEWIGGGMKGPPPVVPVGGIVGISPGRENILTVDLEEGNYALYCFLPDAKDGKEHVQHGMFKQIAVGK